MANFDIAIEIILHHEGGYVNDPDDPGGETNMGITKRDFPHLDIKNLTVHQAKAVYRDKYWNAVRGDRISNQEVANQMFDFAVNAGVNRATKVAQKIMKISADGIFGDQTLGNINSTDFVSNYKLERITFYTKLAKRKTLRKFLYAWVRRALEA